MTRSAVGMKGVIPLNQSCIAKAQGQQAFDEVVAAQLDWTHYCWTGPPRIPCCSDMKQMDKHTHKLIEAHETNKNIIKLSRMKY